MQASYPLPDDIVIINACTEENTIDEHGRFNVHLPGCLELFIKRRSKQSGLLAEARNQNFAFQALNSIPVRERDGIQIPQIHRIIEAQETVYVVMEFVHGQTLLQLLEMEMEITSQLYDRIAMAIRLFLNFEIADGMALGPIEGGLVVHPLFKDCKASIKYESVAHLQQHVHDVANSHQRSHLEINFADEPLCFCFSDLYEGNFMFTDTGVLYVLDFEDVSSLPLSFMAYVVRQPRPVCHAIKDKLDLPWGNIENMQVAGCFFGMSARSIGKYIQT